MFNKQMSFIKMDLGVQNAPWLRGHHYQAISRWIPRRPVLGVEQDGTSLLLVCLKPGWGRAPVSYFGSIPDFASLTAEQLRKKIQEFLKPLVGEEPLVVLGLPRRESMIRFLNLPVAARKSLKEALLLQVEMYKPTDNESFDWDSVVIDGKEQLSAALVLSPRSAVEKFVDLFARAGFPIARITVAQFAQLHLLLRAEPAPQNKRYLLVDGRNQDLELALLEGRKLVYSRSLPLERDGAPVAVDVLSEVRQAFATLRWKEVEGNFVILIAGDLPAALELQLESLGPVRKLREVIRQQALPEQGGLNRYWGAAAIALSAFNGRQAYSINLLPVALRPQRSHSRYLVTYALAAANAVLLLAFLLRIPVENYVLLRQYQKEIAGVQVRASEMRGLLQRERTMQEDIVELDGLQQKGRLPLDALNEIAQKLPQDAWLNTFSCKKGQVELSGSAKAASPLLPLFQSSKQFQDAKFNGALTEDSTGAEHFRLQMKLKEKP